MNDLLIYEVKLYNVSIKYIFNSESILLKTIKDVITDKSNFYRIIGNIKLNVVDNKLYGYKLYIDFNPLKIPSIITESVNNPLFTTFDLETYKNISSISKVYAAGFKTSYTLKTCYIDSNLNSDKVVLDCVDNLLQVKYNNYVFYGHNLIPLIYFCCI